MSTYKIQMLSASVMAVLFAVIFFSYLDGKETAVCVFAAASAVLANIQVLRHGWLLDQLKRGVDSGQIKGRKA